MTSSISQTAGDHAIQFGYIGQIESLSINGVLQVEVGSLKGSAVNASHLEKLQSPQPRPLPVLLAPRSFPLLLGRREEVKVAVDALPYDQPVEFYGSPGIGKTVLLRHLAHHPSITPAFSDGIVYHHSKSYQPVSDLLQILFSAFYESGTPFKPTDIQIRHALKDKRSLIILEAAKLKREEVESLIDSVPSCTFLFASQERQLLGEGHSVGLGGLPLNDAVALVTRELGRNLSSDERLATEKLCTALEGHPLRILQTVALVREENLSLSIVQERILLSASTSSWAEQLLTSLQKPHRLIVTVLAALGGVALGAELLAGLTEIPQVKLVVETLLRRNLVQVDGSRYSLSGTLVEYVQQQWNVTPFLEQAATYFTTWVQQATPQNLLEECDAILQVLEWTVGVGRWSEVICLGRAIEGTLALTGEWGTWNIVLQWLLQAARTIGDQAVEAFALHQLGTRSLCLSEVTPAQDYLTQALRIRESLNDQVGAEVTRNNLQFLLQPPPPPQPEPPPVHSSQKREIPLILKGGIAVLLLVMGGPIAIGWLRNSNQPSSQDETISSTPSPRSPSPSPTLTTSPPTSIPTTPPLTSELSSVFLSSSSVTWGTTVKGTVTLSNPAPDGGVVVNLTSNNPSVVKVSPSSLKVEAGEKSATFKVKTNADGSDYPNGSIVKIAATYAGETETTSLTLESNKPAKPKLTSIDLEQRRVSWGTTVKGIVTLSNPAPDGGVVVYLTSRSPSVAKVSPSSLKVEAGENSASFQVLTSADGSDYPNDSIVEIAATYEGVTETTSLTLESNKPAKPKLTSIDLEQRRVNWGTTVPGTVTLSNPAPDGGVVVNLTSSNPSVAKVSSSSLKVEAGKKGATFEVKTNADGSDDSNASIVEITASLEGEEPQKTELTIYTAQIAPQLQSLQFENGNGVKIESISSRRTRSLQGRVILSAQAPKGGIAIALESKNAAVQETVTVEEGETTATFPVRILLYDVNQKRIDSVEIKAFYQQETRIATLTVTPPIIKVPSPEVTFLPGKIPLPIITSSPTNSILDIR